MNKTLLWHTDHKGIYPPYVALCASKAWQRFGSEKLSWCLPSRRGLTPRGSLECNPEIPAFPGEEN